MQGRGSRYIGPPRIHKDSSPKLVTFTAPGIAKYDPHNGKNRWGSLAISFEKRKRIPHLAREAVAIVILRRKGQAMQTISEFLGRSLSYVHKVISFNKTLHNLPKWLDLRKLPAACKHSAAKLRLKTMLKLWSAWQAFIEGSEDKPP